MSDYRIRVIIRNNRLLKAMEAKGFKSASQFERSYGFNNYAMINLINGSNSPLNKKGEIRPFVKEILDILEISITDAFTEKQLQGFKKNSFTIEAKESQLMQLTSARKPLEMNLIESDVNKLIKNLLSTLPEKYQIAIQMHIFENKPFKDVADVLKVSKARAQQLVVKGINKLKTNSNFSKLIESGAIDLFENTKFKKPEKLYTHFNPIKKQTLPTNIIN